MPEGIVTLERGIVLEEIAWTAVRMFLQFEGETTEDLKGKRNWFVKYAVIQRLQHSRSEYTRIGMYIKC